MKKCKCGALFMILTVIGGLNWGLIGLFDFNLVTAIFGEMSTATNIVYIVIGVASLLSIPHIRKSICEIKK